MSRATIKLKRPITEFELDVDENSLQLLWIPVTERLPEESGSYLIVDSGNVTEAFYGKEWAGNNWTDPVDMYMTFHPTHWMSLPQPPKSEDE